MAARRLDLRADVIWRFHKRGSFPAPDLTFGSDSIWVWNRIEQWSDTTFRALRLPPRDPSVFTLDLVDLDEIARRLECRRPIVGVWRYSNTLPWPDYRFSSGDAWLWRTIEEWERRAGRILSPLVRHRHRTTFRVIADELKRGYAL